MDNKNVEVELNKLFEAICDLRLTIGRTEDAVFQPQPCCNGENAKMSSNILTERIGEAILEVSTINSRLCVVEKTIADQLQGLKLK